MNGILEKAAKDTLIKDSNKKSLNKFSTNFFVYSKRRSRGNYWGSKEAWNILFCNSWWRTSYIFKDKFLTESYYF